MRAQRMETTLRKCQETMRRYAHTSSDEQLLDILTMIAEIDAVLDRGQDAGVAKLADALGLGPSAARRGGSSPSARTKTQEKPLAQYTSRDATFEVWLEQEHPAHSEFDFENKMAYKRWLSELREAFNAGWKARKIAQYSK